MVTHPQLFSLGPQGLFGEGFRVLANPLYSNFLMPQQWGF
jgi:hypothetical protein